jgi:Cu/Ag efflux protein CusF
MADMWRIRWVGDGVDLSRMRWVGVVSQFVDVGFNLGLITQPTGATASASIKDFEKADEEIRTLDIDLGKVALYH